MHHRTFPRLLSAYASASGAGITVVVPRALPNLITFHIYIATFHELTRQHSRDCVRTRRYLGGAVGCVRDGGSAATGDAALPADGMVLSSNLDTLAHDRGPHQEALAPAEFSGILRAAVVDSADGVLGDGADFRVRADSTRYWRPRTIEQRADHVRPNPVSQRGDFFHTGLRRHCADVGWSSGSVGDRSRNGIRVSGRSDRIHSRRVCVVFPPGDPNFDAGCTSGIASIGDGVAGAAGQGIGRSGRGPE